MKLTILFLLLSLAVSAQKINYTINNGLQIQGVDGTNSVIFCNDIFLDTPEGYFLWLKANKGQIKLVGNISTRDMYLVPNLTVSHDNTWGQWQYAYAQARADGLKNIPAPVKGAGDYLRKPASAVIEQTSFVPTPGSNLIVQEALKATPEKPLILLIGGNATTLANAYLQNNSIASRIIVFHVDGHGRTAYNAIDWWSAYIVMKRFKYINWHGNTYSWYDPFRPLAGVNITGLPTDKALARAYRDGYYQQSYGVWKDVADGPPAFYLFDHSLFRNVVRMKENGVPNGINNTNPTQTTANDFDYLLVTDNNWAGFGPMLSNYINDRNNYTPGTTPPPNIPPTVEITSPSAFEAGPVTLSANAVDIDGVVVRVEFFNGATKLGEDVQAPYSIGWTAVPGSFSISAKATDNVGGSTTSGMIVTITPIVIPPDSTNCSCTKGDKGDKGDQGIQGIQGPIGNCTGCPSGGGGSQTKNTFDVTAYGANPNDNVNDLGAFQAAYDAARGVAGKVVIPSSGGGTYYLDGTWNITPDGSNQVWVDIEMVGGRAGTIRYRGPSNQPVVRIVGLKGALWTGLNIAIEDGRSGVQLFDIDTTPSAGSSSFVTFKTFYCNLGNGQNNSAFRLGHNSGGGADISNYQWENCIVFGGGKLGSSGLVEAIPGQIAYHVEGNNTLSQTWIGGFVAGCDRIFSNKNGAGAKVDRGNGSVFFYGLGSSQNNIDYDINFEQNYLIIGGRYESSNSILTTATHSFHAAITFQDIQFNDYKSDHLFDINTAATLYIKNCRMNKKSGALNDLVRCSAQGGAGTITIESGGTNAVNLIRQDGGGTFKKYVRGVGKFSDVNGVFIGSHYPDQNGN